MAIITRAQGDTGFKLIGVWLVIDDVYETSRRVTTKQRALRAPQNLHPIHVIEIDKRTLWTAVVDTIDIHTNFGVLGCCPVNLSDTSDENEHGVAVYGAVINRGVWAQLF